MTKAKAVERSIIRQYLEECPGEVHIVGRFFYNPEDESYWHWCAHVEHSGACHLVRPVGKDEETIRCVWGDCEDTVELPAAFKLYLKLF